MSPVSEEPLAEEQPQMIKPSSTPHFVLVHGISGGGWCWYKIRALLEAAGYKVSCIDLKSAGIDPSDPDSILTFDDYNKPLIDFLKTLPDNNDKIILVGHSAGGLSVTHATHSFGKKIDLAVYVAATMLRSGFMTDEDLIDGVPEFSEFGEVYELGFGLGLHHPPTSAVIKKEFQQKILYQMSSVEDSTLASMLLKPGPVQALMGARFTEEKDVDEVKRIYIKTTHDHVIKPNQQEAMLKTWPPSDVFVLESDHSPFFSAASELFTILTEASSSTLLS